MTKQANSPNLSRQELFRDKEDRQILFFRVPLSFQLWQGTFRELEKDVYLYFMIQIYYKNSLSIEVSNEELRHATGIKSKKSVIKAIYGLCEKGWIKNIIYQANRSNIYIVNLEPEVNKELLKRIYARSKNTSKAKKKSIENGEKGKFQKLKEKETINENSEN